jgi:hypothetical protein
MLILKSGAKPQSLRWFSLNTWGLKHERPTAEKVKRRSLDKDTQHVPRVHSRRLECSTQRYIAKIGAGCNVTMILLIGSRLTSRPNNYPNAKIMERKLQSCVNKTGLPVILESIVHHSTKHFRNCLRQAEYSFELCIAHLPFTVKVGHWKLWWCDRIW